MNPHHLVTMANDIAHFFAAEPDHAVAVDSVANHLKKFWEPRMRRQLIAYAVDGAGELHPLIIEALPRVAPAAA